MKAIAGIRLLHGWKMSIGEGWAGEGPVTLFHQVLQHKTRLVSAAAERICFPNLFYAV